MKTSTDHRKPSQLTPAQRKVRDQLDKRTAERAAARARGEAQHRRSAA